MQDELKEIWIVIQRYEDGLMDPSNPNPCCTFPYPDVSTDDLLNEELPEGWVIEDNRPLELYGGKWGDLSAGLISELIDIHYGGIFPGCDFVFCGYYKDAQALLGEILPDGWRLEYLGDRSGVDEPFGHNFRLTKNEVGLISQPGALALSQGRTH